MHFRVQYVVTRLSFPVDSPVEIALDGPHSLHVLLRRPNSEEQQQGHDALNSFCIASSERNPSTKIREIFDRIDADEILGPDGVVGCEYTNSQGRRVRIPGIQGFPDFFRSFIQDVHSELDDLAARTTRVLRWRIDEPGPPRPFSTRGLTWSFDGLFWNPAPSTTSVYLLDSQGTVRLNASQNTDLLSLVAAQHDEPIHHVLYREAWEERHSNPGSALVIGMAALEVAIKSLVAVTIPDARWLVMNVPTPPLVRLLVDYLPTLPVRNTFAGKVKPPPASLLDEIRKGITIRNELAHVGQPPPDYDTLEKVLLAARDCLWLVDYYSGHAWAAEHIRASVLAELR